MAEVIGVNTVSKLLTDFPGFLNSESRDLMERIDYSYWKKLREKEDFRMKLQRKMRLNSMEVIPHGV